MTSSSSGRASCVDAPVGEDGGRRVQEVLPDGVDGVGADPGVQVAEQADEAEQQRRQGEQGEERRLGGEPEDPVLDAGVDGVLEQQPGHLALGDVAVEGSRPAEASALARSGVSSGWLHLLNVSAMAASTHTVTNQAAASGRTTTSSRRTRPSPRASRGTPRPSGAEEVRAELSELGRGAGLGAGPGVGQAGQREPAGAAYARPVRQPHRRGRLPPGLAPADGPRRRRGPDRRLVAAATGNCGAPRASSSGRRSRRGTAARCR